MKNPKNLIAGVVTFAVLSMPLWAIASSIKEDVSELKKIIPNILTAHEICYKKFEGKNHYYKIEASMDDKLELEVYNKESYDVYSFVDRGPDGTLDVYIGSKGFEFTPKNTCLEKWEKLESSYHKFIREILPLAKNILNEKNSSLDEDLKSLE